MLESEDAVSWMNDIQGAKLKNMGGDVNRLYQLFIEAKGKYVLMVDSEMYKAASLQTDMFSSRQCKDLATRSEQVAL